MEIKHFKLVKSIVEQGSIAKAKEKLHLTQSALSHQLKELEIQAGTAIFDRVGKRLILTPAGNLLYNTSIDILRQTEELENKIRLLAKCKTGTIRISSGCFTNYHWLPGLMKKFHAIHPEVEVKINLEATKNPIAELFKRELDIAITNNSSITPNIEYTEIVKDQLFAVIPFDHPYNNKKYLVAEDFKDQNLIIFAKPMDTVVIYNKVLKPAYVEPRKVYEMPFTEAMIGMIAAGMGIAVIPEWVVSPYFAMNKVAIKKVTRNGLFRSLGVARLKQNAYPEYHQTFIRFLIENWNADKIKDV